MTDAGTVAVADSVADSVVAVTDRVGDSVAGSVSDPVPDSVVGVMTDEAHIQLQIQWPVCCQMQWQI